MEVRTLEKAATGIRGRTTQGATAAPMRLLEAPIQMEGVGAVRGKDGARRRSRRNASICVDGAEVLLRRAANRRVRVGVEVVVAVVEVEVRMEVVDVVVMVKVAGEELGEGDVGDREPRECR